MNQYGFYSDDGDVIETLFLHDDDAAEKTCQRLANREGVHVTCDRVICSCDPVKENAAEQRNEATAEAQNAASYSISKISPLGTSYNGNNPIHWNAAF